MGNSQRDVFAQWLRAVGTVEIAKALGVTRATAWAWADRSRAPRPEKAARLIKMSRGVLTWHAIYQPFVNRKKSR